MNYSSRSETGRSRLCSKISHERNLNAQIKTQARLENTPSMASRRSKTGRPLGREETLKREEERFFAPAPTYYCYKPEFDRKGLRLSENPSIFEEDALKLQNFITGAYSEGEEYLSLATFNKHRDNFVLLQEIYEEALRKPVKKREEKFKYSTRNLLLLAHLNEVKRKMKKSDSANIMARLKIVP